MLGVVVRRSGRCGRRLHAGVGVARSLLSASLVVSHDHPCFLSENDLLQRPIGQGIGFPSNGCDSQLGWHELASLHCEVGIVSQYLLGCLSSFVALSLVTYRVVSPHGQMSIQCRNFP